MDDYDKRKKRLEREIELLRIKKMMHGKSIHYKRGPGLLFWIFILALIIYALYSFGIIDFSSIISKIN